MLYCPEGTFPEMLHVWEYFRHMTGAEVTLPDDAIMLCSNPEEYRRTLYDYRKGIDHDKNKEANYPIIHGHLLVYFFKRHHCATMRHANHLWRIDVWETISKHSPYRLMAPLLKDTTQ